MYDGYAWLTNAIATDLLRFRLLLLGGMGGFLVIALAIPSAYDDKGLAFGLGYAVVVVLHAGMYAKGTSVSEVAAILRLVPFNLTAAAMVLVGGAAGGRPQDVLWAGAALLLWFTPWFTSTEGFVIAAEHFCERHGLVIIVALGESIVVVGAGAVGVPLDLRLAVVALLALALSGVALVAVLPRRGRRRARDAGRADEARRARLALVGFGYWHYGLLLGVVAVAAGLKKAVGDPYDPLAGWIGIELGVGVALFAACTVGFRTTLGIGVSRSRLVAAAAALATIPIGTEWSAAGSSPRSRRSSSRGAPGRGEAGRRIAQRRRLDSRACRAPSSRRASSRRRSRRRARHRADLLRRSGISAEISLEEVESCEVHIRELEAAGFTIVSTGTSGVPTAFVAEWTPGQAAVRRSAFCPSTTRSPVSATPPCRGRSRARDGQDERPRLRPQPARRRPAPAPPSPLRPVMEADEDRRARCACTGAPRRRRRAPRSTWRATASSTISMPVSHWHPRACRRPCMNLRLAAVNIDEDRVPRPIPRTRASSRGRGAARSTRSELAAHGLNLMREHLEPTARIHYVYEAGGDRTECRARLRPHASCSVRDIDRARVGRHHRVGAADRGGRGARDPDESRTSTSSFGMHDLLPNTPLAERMQVHLDSRRASRRGPSEEQAFARECQTNDGACRRRALASNRVAAAARADDRRFLRRRRRELEHADHGHRLCRRCRIERVALHTWPVTACGGMSIGLKRHARRGEGARAMTALDVLTDAELRKAARADFERRTEGFTYVSPLPPYQASPRRSAARDSSHARS